MRLPIQIALTYPERVAGSNVKPLDLVRLGELHFEPPQMRQFPALGLALKAGLQGGTYPAALAAADEAAVGHFLAGQLKFTDIPVMLEETLTAHRNAADTELEAILEADAWARAFADDWVRARS
jgi:1-deoxy-D-xylulose-5-phosphate reductoisomerase